MLEGSSLDRISEFLSTFIYAINDNLLEPLDFQISSILVNCLDKIFDTIISKPSLNTDSLRPDSRILFNIISRCFGMLNVHSIFGKQESSENYSLKVKCLNLYTKLDQILGTNSLQ